jgi:hypothetical protein
LAIGNWKLFALVFPFYPAQTRRQVPQFSQIFNKKTAAPHNYKKESDNYNLWRRSPK